MAGIASRGSNDVVDLRWRSSVRNEVERSVGVVCSEIEDAQIAAGRAARPVRRGGIEPSRGFVGEGNSVLAVAYLDSRRGKIKPNFFRGDASLLAGGWKGCVGNEIIASLGQ